MELTAGRKVYQLKCQEEVAAVPVQALSTNTAPDVLLPQAQPPSRDLPTQRATHLPQPAVPLQVFSTLLLSFRTLLLLAVKTETFYGVYKPEVTQLNETICHIKFTSAGIKRQIT